MLDPAIQATFEACLAAVRQGDAEAFQACFQEGAEGSGSLAGDLQGPAGFAAALVALKARLPELRIEPLRTYGEGPEMATRLRLSAGAAETEGVWAFRFGPDGRIARLVSLWEPAELLGAAPRRLDGASRAAVMAYFRTYNENDEDAHAALISPELVYFGSVSRITAEGVETARGIFRSAHDRMGLKRFDPIRTYGSGADLAVLTRIHGARAGGPTEEGIWVFRLDARHRFDRVSILWNPGSFLAWGPR